MSDGDKYYEKNEVGQRGEVKIYRAVGGPFKQRPRGNEGAGYRDPKREAWLCG